MLNFTVNTIYIRAYGGLFKKKKVLIRGFLLYSVIHVNNYKSLPFIAVMTFTSRGVKSFVPYTVDRMRTSWVKSLSTRRRAIFVGLLAAFAKS